MKKAIIVPKEHFEEQMRRTADPLKQQFIKLEMERSKRAAGESSQEDVLREAQKYADMANERGAGFAEKSKKEFNGVSPYLLAK